jgi:TPP-dependent trihydroxycyclohexane-1,2-dione (THcHDO) dehydratase
MRAYMLAATASGGNHMTKTTTRLTTAQALVRWLTRQFTKIDGERVPLFAGVFGIFGHGNVTCLSEALEAVQDELPTWRGQNEQSMALAATAPLHVDFVRHAEAMGAAARHCESLADFGAALQWAKTTDRTTVISIMTDPHAWVPGDADWDVGVPEVSTRESVRTARKHQLEIRSKQRVGV